MKKILRFLFKPIYITENPIFKQNNYKVMIILLSLFFLSSCGFSYIEDYSEKKKSGISLFSYSKLNKSYWKDKSYIYYLTPIYNKTRMFDINVNTTLKKYSYSKINNVDYNSFKIIAGWLAMDKNNLYYKWEKKENIDSNSFKIIWNKYKIKFFKDKNNVYIYYNSSNRNWYLHIIKWADSKTFDIIYTDINDSYFKDKNNVYMYNISAGTSWYKIIKWADSKTFEIINVDTKLHYFKDKNNVYFRWNKVEIIDYLSVKYISSSFLKDKNNLYYFILDTRGNNVISRLDRVFTPNDIIIDFDSINFIGWEYYKDKNNLYQFNKNNKNFIIENIKFVDLNTLEFISRGYLKDKNNVYFYSKKIEWADPNSFEIDYNSWWWQYSKDKKNKYFKWKRID